MYESNWNLAQKNLNLGPKTLRKPGIWYLEKSGNPVWEFLKFWPLFMVKHGDFRHWNDPRFAIKQGDFRPKTPSFMEKQLYTLLSGHRFSLQMILKHRNLRLVNTLLCKSDSIMWNHWDLWVKTLLFWFHVSVKCLKKDLSNYDTTRDWKAWNKQPNSYLEEKNLYP